MNDPATPVLMRSRPIYALWIGLVIALGLASRHWGYLLPPILRKNAGDGLWALVVFLLLGFALPSRSTLWTAVGATLISVLDEFSQMYHAPWIDSIRATTFGHLILGSDFAWTDLLDYLIGITLGVTAELLMKRRIQVGQIRK